MTHGGYSLNLECLLKDYLLKAWSPMQTAFRGGLSHPQLNGELVGGGSYRQWGIIGGSGSLGMCPRMLFAVHVPPPLCLSAAMSWTTFLSHTLLPWDSTSLQAQSSGAFWPWAETISQNKPSLLQDVFFRYLSQWWKTTTMTLFLHLFPFWPLWLHLPLLLPLLTKNQLPWTPRCSFLCSSLTSGPCPH